MACMSVGNETTGGGNKETAGQYFSGFDFSDSSLIVVPGTSDRDGATLTKWSDFIVNRFTPEQTHIIDYPATVGPLVGGRQAHRYDESLKIAHYRTRAALARTAGRVVLLGYSQGADAMWRGVVDAVEAGDKDASDLEVILWAHPQYPGGLKDSVRRHHKVTSALFKYAFQAEMDGVWRPHQDIATTSVAMERDPVTHFPRMYPNPIRGAREFRDGFFMIHSGLGDEGAAQFENLPIANKTNIPGTRTTYLELATRDPRVQQAEFRRHDLL